MNDAPSDPAPDRHELLAQLERLLGCLKQKADQAAAQKKVCTITAGEAQALVEALAELVDELKEGPHLRWITTVVVKSRAWGKTEHLHSGAQPE